jgi:hypothetical protein
MLTASNTTQKVLLSLALWSLIPCGTCCQDQKVEHGRAVMNEKDTWAVSLTVSPSAQGVLATVTFANNGSVPAALYKWNACAGNQIHNDVFEIMHESGSVPYTGRMVKRGEPTASDFLIVQPGEKVSFQVDLRAAYKFPAGSHRYRIRYSALNPYLGRTGFDALKSNEFAFEYSN